MPTIFMIRHAEKPDGTNQGIDETGAMDDESLIVRGWQRAGALAVFFGSPKGLPAPDRVYASAVTDERETPAGKIGSKSKRPTETVTPLAAKLGQTVTNTYTEGQEADLVQEVAALHGTTLVCWHHEAIPKIATLILGSAKGVRDPWPSDRFDVVWRFISSHHGKKWKFDQVCQQVLAGDSAKPIS
jgi:broad specificity phosphatase PhoE